MGEANGRFGSGEKLRAYVVTAISFSCIISPGSIRYQVLPPRYSEWIVMIVGDDGLVLQRTQQLRGAVQSSCSRCGCGVQ